VAEDFEEVGLQHVDRGLTGRHRAVLHHIRR